MKNKYLLLSIATISVLLATVGLACNESVQRSTTSAAGQPSAAGQTPPVAQVSGVAKSLQIPVMSAAVTPQIADATPPGAQGAIKTELVKKGDGWVMMRGGKPFFIRGVGGDFSKEKLVAIGGNAYRTWGTPNRAELDAAQKLGLGVCVGIWLGNTPEAIRGAQGQVERTVREFKDHPAVLCWGIGNEMENAQPNNPEIWKALDQLAVAAKAIDPNHPTMTVLAELGGGASKVKMLHQYCPNIDIAGLNSYAGCSSVPQRYKEVGGTKPYAITEYGPPGQWESQRTAWRSAFELNSTDKGERYRQSWRDAMASQAGGLSVGGYAFLWGNKNEATPTWYGMMLPDGETLGPMEAMQEEWTGKSPPNRCPKFTSLKVDGEASVKAGDIIKARADVIDPDGDQLKYEWILRGDSRDNSYGGNARAAVEALANAIIKGDGPNCELKLPGAGAFRLFVYIHDGKGNAAVGNIPLQAQ
jgi:hypothetical protein